MNGAVITALNEAGTIAELVYQLKRQGLAVCVVNDGSSDDTGIVAELAGAHVIHHRKPQGIGKSLMEAWKYSLSQGWDYTLQIDAGKSHDPKEYANMSYDISLVDVVIGSRFIVDNNYLGGSWIRKNGSKITAKICNFLARQDISDWTSGYRIFSKKALEILSIQNYMTNMHTWQIEVLYSAFQHGLKVRETGITYRAGRSTMKLQTVDDLFKVLLWMFFQ
jgi:glycosyltransferase involved in cell wall biosynthesis